MHTAKSVEKLTLRLEIIDKHIELGYFLISTTQPLSRFWINIENKTLTTFFYYLALSFLPELCLLSPEVWERLGCNSAFLNAISPIQKSNR